MFTDEERDIVIDAVRRADNAGERVSVHNLVEIVADVCAWRIIEFGDEFDGYTDLERKLMLLTEPEVEDFLAPLPLRTRWHLV